MMENILWFIDKAEKGLEKIRKENFEWDELICGVAWLIANNYKMKKALIDMFYVAENISELFGK
jgi:hypothetical protein